MLGALTRTLAIHTNGKAFISNLNRRDLEPVVQLFQNTIKKIEEMKVGQSICLLSPVRRDLKEFVQVFEKGAERADSILKSSKTSRDVFALRESMETFHKQSDKLAMMPSNVLQMRTKWLQEGYDKESTENLEKIHTTLTQASNWFSFSVLSTENAIERELQEGGKDFEEKGSISFKTQQASDWVDQTLNAISKVVDEDNQKAQDFLENVKAQGKLLRMVQPLKEQIVDSIKDGLSKL